MGGFQGCSRDKQAIIGAVRKRPLGPFDQKIFCGAFGTHSLIKIFGASRNSAPLLWVGVHITHASPPPPRPNLPLKGALAVPVIEGDGQCLRMADG